MPQPPNLASYKFRLRSQPYHTLTCKCSPVMVLVSPSYRFSIFFPGLTVMAQCDLVAILASSNQRTLGWSLK